MTMPELTGVLETALYFRNLEVSTAFYQKIFGFETLYADERLRALNVCERQVLLLFLKRTSNAPMVSAGGTIPPTDGDGHPCLAFSIAASEF